MLFIDDFYKKGLNEHSVQAFSISYNEGITSVPA